jgi:hypothetical protein
MFGRRRPSRRFRPSLGFDNLERRLCLDGSADGTDDPVYDAELADVGGDENFDQTDETNLQGQNPEAWTFGGAVAGMVDPSKQDIIDAMEAARANVNDAAQAFYTAAQNYQNALASYKAQRLAQTTDWPADWATNPHTIIEARMCDEMTWIQNEQERVTNDVASIKQQVAAYNQAITDAENNIEVIYMLMGYNDDGDPILEPMYESQDVSGLA